MARAVIVTNKKEIAERVEKEIKKDFPWVTHVILLPTPVPKVTQIYTRIIGGGEEKTTIFYDPQAVEEKDIIYAWMKAQGSRTKITIRRVAV